MRESLRLLLQRVYERAGENESGLIGEFVGKRRLWRESVSQVEHQARRVSLRAFFDASLTKW
jgi:hypothetical protein